MATALELTRKGWSLYVEAMSRRVASPELTLEEQQERRQLLTRVREAAAMLKRRFAVRRVGPVRFACPCILVFPQLRR